jgi:inner membrane transporter RhtA
LTAHRTTTLPVAVLIVAMTSVQFGASVAKGLFPLVGAAGLTCLRLAFGALIMGVALRVWRVSIRATSLWPVLIYGFSLGVMNLTYYMSLRTLPLGIAVTLEFTGPLAVAIWSSRRLVDMPWIVLSVIGLLCLTQVRGGTRIDPLGAAFALGAGACWASYIVYGQKAGAHHGMQSAAIGAIIAALVVAPFGIISGGANLFASSVVPGAVGVAVLSTALPYSLEMFALTRLSARTFGILMSAEPALGSLIGWCVLHEKLGLPQWLGVLAIAAASAGTSLTGANPPAASPPD